MDELFRNLTVEPKAGPMHRVFAVFSMLVLLCGVAGCGFGSGATPDGDRDQTTVNVFAAASLTDAFTELANVFEAANPDLSVALNVAGSSSLRAQILDGAPADVFASADEATMAQVLDAGAINGPVTIFATNRLTIAAPSGNPAAVSGLADFARPELFIGLCSEVVPCGALAAADLAAAGLVPAVDSFEPDVRALLTKVSEGELDAGLVYVTDILADPSVEEIGPAPELVSVTRYPIATIDRGTGDPSSSGADRFVAFVTGDEGQAVLADFGFGTP